MSKVLAIPDVHLKPEIFIKATRIMESGQADFAVQLGDIPDDWNKHLDLNLYDDTYNAAIKFAKQFPNTLWCWGNHDYSYPFRMNQSGYSYEAAPLVRRKIVELSEIAIPKITHLVDNVLFSHAGLTETFVKRLIPDDSKWDEDVDYILNLVDDCNPDELWLSSSPLWTRPQSDYNSLGELIHKEYRTKMWKENKYLQVVGHTPTKKIEQLGRILTTDVFSTYNDEEAEYPPIGEQKFAIVDTVNKTWKYAKE